MKVTVKYFGMSREVVGLREEEVSLTEPSLLKDLLVKIFSTHPALEPMKSTLRAFVNGRWGSDSVELKDKDQVAFIPPVGGG